MTMVHTIRYGVVMPSPMISNTNLFQGLRHNVPKERTYSHFFILICAIKKCGCISFEPSQVIINWNI